MIHLIDALAILYSCFKYLGYDRVQVSTISTEAKLMHVCKEIKEKLDNHINRLRLDPNDKVLAVFDSSTDYIRNELYDQYKQNRISKDQIPFAQKFKHLKAILLPGIECIDAPRGYEADDVIATLAKKAKIYKERVQIHTSDTDLLQLVDQTTSCHLYSFKTWKYGTVSCFADKGFKNKNYQLTPKQTAYMKALGGDAIDNIPGFIPYKDGNKLIREYETIDGIYENIDKIEHMHKTTLIEWKDDIYRNLKLVTLVDDLDINFPWVNK